MSCDYRALGRNFECIDFQGPCQSVPSVTSGQSVDYERSEDVADATATGGDHSPRQPLQLSKSNRTQFFLKPQQQQQQQQDADQQHDFHHLSGFNSGERILSPSKLQSTPNLFMHQSSPFRDDDDDVEDDDERPTDYSLKFQVQSQVQEGTFDCLKCKDCRAHKGILKNSCKSLLT